MQTYHALQETGTIAILRGWSCIQAMPLVQALYAGGIRMAEVAVDNLDAFETVAKLRKIWDGKMYIGAGRRVRSLSSRQIITRGLYLCAKRTASWFFPVY